jgi:uncharacterized protein YkwD
MPGESILKSAFLSISCLLFFSMKNPPSEKLSEAPGYETPPVSVVHMTTEILYYVNIHRRSMRLQPLQLSNVESTLAVQHSVNMASNKTPFGHRGLEQRAKIIEGQLGKISTVAENVASGSMSAKEVVDGWLNSPGHKRNIEGDFTLTGIGVAKNDKNVLYYTQIFSK